MPGFAEFEPVSYQVVNSTEIIAVFDLTDAPHGQYDVSVINPDGAEADAPYSYLVEQAAAALDHPRPGRHARHVFGRYRLLWLFVAEYNECRHSLCSRFEFGVPSLGTNITVNAPYVALSSNVAGSPNVAGCPGRA